MPLHGFDSGLKKGMACGHGTEVMKIERDKKIKITVFRGIVWEANGLPPGYEYEIDDLDV